MRITTRALAGVLVAMLLACGSSSTGPAVSRNNPGTGTTTLNVMADIDAANVPGGYGTDYTVSVCEDSATRYRARR